MNEEGEKEDEEEVLGEKIPYWYSWGPLTWDTGSACFASEESSLEEARNRVTNYWGRDGSKELRTCTPIEEGDSKIVLLQRVWSPQILNLPHNNYQVGKSDDFHVENGEGAKGLTKMPRDLWVTLMSVWLEKEDVARLDSAMSERRGRNAMLEVLRSEFVCYEGSKGEKDELSFDFLRWASLRSVSLRALIPMKDVPSALVCSVAMNSPDLEYLAMNYNPNNQMFLQHIETRCHKIVELMLRNTEVNFGCMIKPCDFSFFGLTFLLGIDPSEVTVELVEDGEDESCSTFSRVPRLKIDDWHREPGDEMTSFSWKRFLYSYALIKAANFGEKEIVEQLLVNDACDVNAQNFYGFTALMLAAMSGHQKIVALLLEKDSKSINCQDIKNGDTALILACKYFHDGCFEAIEHLIKRGANKDLKDRENLSAFDILESFSILSDSEMAYLKNL